MILVVRRLGSNHFQITKLSEQYPDAVDRYSAKLLFQFRVDVDGDPGKRRLCEERIVVIEAKTAQAALEKSRRRGKRAEHSYTNDNGNTVNFDSLASSICSCLVLNAMTTRCGTIFGNGYYRWSDETSCYLPSPN